MPLVTRRKFLCGAVAAVAGVYGYARLLEPGWLDVTRLELPLQKLPDAFAGVTIAQISDLHFGPFMQAPEMAQVVEHVNSAEPDLIVITGDLVSRVDQGEPGMIVETLRRWRAPLGVYAILGNHDWWEGASTVSDALARAGVVVLSNRNVPLKRDGQTLHLAGVDDVWCGKHDLTAALAGIPARSAVIALVHEPDFADTLAGDARVLLQLSGHSHGGQVRVPFCGGIWYPPWARKYPRGLYAIRDLTLYTNRGIGMVSRPIRFACRPEITFLTLSPMP
jgi:predicted MPP superfamily phosphohydrolase